MRLPPLFVKKHTYEYTLNHLYSQTCRESGTHTSLDGIVKHVFELTGLNNVTRFILLAGASPIGPMKEEKGEV